MFAFKDIALVRDNVNPRIDQTMWKVKGLPPNNVDEVEDTTHFQI